MISDSELLTFVTTDDSVELEDYLSENQDKLHDATVLNKWLAELCNVGYINCICTILNKEGADPLTDAGNGLSILESSYDKTFGVMFVLLRHVAEKKTMDRKTVSETLRSVYFTVGSASSVTKFCTNFESTEALLYVMRTVDDNLLNQRNYVDDSSQQDILHMLNDMFVQDSTKKWILYCNSERRKNKGSCSQPYFCEHNFNVALISQLITKMGENGFGLHKYTFDHIFLQNSPSDWKTYTSSIKKAFELDTMSSLEDDHGAKIVPSPLQSMALLALLTGRFNLAEMFVRMHQFDIVPMALLMKLVALRLAEKELPNRTKHRLDSFSKTMENIAVDTLQHVYSEDLESDQLLQYLERPLTTYGCESILELAKKAKCTTYFFSRTYCDEIWMKRWNGCLTGSSTLILWLVTFFTLFVVLLRRSEKHFKRLELQTGGLLQQWYELGSTPKVKYLFHSVYHCLFLLLFSYVVLLDFHFKPTGGEVICYVYVLGYAVDELLQIRSFVQKKNTKTYFTDFWNCMDLTAVFLTLLGLVVRCCRISVMPETAELEAHETVLYVSRVLLSLALISFYVRTLYMFYISENLGPKLTMIGTILKDDIFPILKIFLIFIIAFGVSFQAILYPNGYPIESSHNSTGLGSAYFIGNLFRRAFYGMLGPDYPLDELECSEGNNCPSKIGSNLFMYGYQVVYVIIVNVLLLNVLIALLSNTVSKIDEQSREIWVAGKERLFEEYKTQSLFPPPFNLISKPVEAIYQRNKKNCEKHFPSILPYLLIQTFGLEGKRHQLGKVTQMGKQDQEAFIKAEEEASIKVEEMSEKISNLSSRLDKLDIEMSKRLDKILKRLT